MPPKVKPLANRSRIAVPSFYLRISSAPRNVGSFPRLVSKYLSSNVSRLSDGDQEKTS